MHNIYFKNAYQQPLKQVPLGEIMQQFQKCFKLHQIFLKMDMLAEWEVLFRRWNLQRRKDVSGTTTDTDGGR